MEGNDGPVTHELSSAESPSMAVVHTLAALHDCSAVAIKPLAESVDPDAVNRLIEDGDDVACTFSTTECVVQVDTQRVIAWQEE